MQKYFSQLVLNDAETKVAFIICQREQMKIVTYDLEAKQMQEQYQTTSSIQGLNWWQDELIFLQDGMLKKLKDEQAYVITACEQFVMYEEGIAYLFNGEVNYIKSLNQIKNKILLNNVQQLFTKGGKGFIVQKEQKLYAYLSGNLVELPLQETVSTAAISDDAQYIACFAEQYGQMHVIVYDRTLHIVQNMTELLGDPIGNTLTTLEGVASLAPFWTETNAFYFLVTANNEVRLYYGDLYGTLLPASPEDECIYAYAIARSGNWAVTAVETLTGEHQLLFLNITTGKQQLIL